jgi:hypothetical protein
MRVLGLKYVVVGNCITAYEWQIGPLYGRFTKLRYWWRCPRLKPFGVELKPGESPYDGKRRVTFWGNAVFIGWDAEWKALWDAPETSQ